MDTLKMNKPSFLLRLWNILLFPSQAWSNIQTEKHNRNFLFWNWGFPLILIMAVAGVLGEAVVAHPKEVRMESLFISSVSIVIFSTLSLFLSAWVIKTFASQLVPEKKFDAAFRLTVYSYTAGFVANSLALLLPLYSFLSVLGLYSFYLLWQGMEPILNIPKDKKSGYFAFILIGLITIYVILGLALTSFLSIYSATEGA